MTKFLKEYDDDKQTDLMKFEECGGKCQLMPERFLKGRDTVSSTRLNVTVRLPPRRRPRDLYGPRHPGGQPRPEEGLPLQALSARRVLRTGKPAVRLRHREAVHHRQAQQDRQLQAEGGRANPSLWSHDTEHVAEFECFNILLFYWRFRIMITLRKNYFLTP